MLTLVKAEIRQAGFDDLMASGVVITGGSTLLEGMPEMAEEILGLPVERHAAKHWWVGGRCEKS